VRAIRTSARQLRLRAWAGSSAKPSWKPPCNWKPNKNLRAENEDTIFVECGFDLSAQTHGTVGGVRISYALSSADGSAYTSVHPLAPSSDPVNPPDMRPIAATEAWAAACAS
jgi:hypothetical protein